jgi:hypothetical protein
VPRVRNVVLRFNFGDRLAILAIGLQSIAQRRSDLPLFAGSKPTDSLASLPPAPSEAKERRRQQEFPFGKQKREKKRKEFASAG